VAAASGVSDQPFSDEETYTGASNRLEAAKTHEPSADFWVSFEGGIEEKNGEIETFAWVLVSDKNGILGKGRSVTFYLPSIMADLIREGKELGEANDIVFGSINSKQHNGASGALTGGVVTRTSYYVGAAIHALIPFKNLSLYHPKG
ncbi:DUF84 family protein, partial [Patescibacteria group bacterium]|nr:DUF84 family protein [Patescibacteria group bacterium]